MPSALYPNTVTSVNSALESNKLHFEAIEQQIITCKVIKQLVACKFSSQVLRISLSVLMQTIGFNKREDDINGARFEQITGIRADHANKTASILVENNILLSRKGRYGKWFSLNFNFAQWTDKKPTEKVISSPQDLLPDWCKKPQDTGLYVDDLYQDKLEAEIDPPDLGVTTDNKTKNTTTTAKPTISKMDEIETTLSKTGFNYPPQLNFAEKSRISVLLKKAGDKAQMLLDILAKRLQKTDNPLASPVAYFTSLINKLIQGDLSIKPHKKPKNKPAQAIKLTEDEKQKKSVLFNYHYFARQISNTAKHKKCTFTEALQYNGFFVNWDKILADLEKLGLNMPNPPVFKTP